MIQHSDVSPTKEAPTIPHSLPAEAPATIGAAELPADTGNIERLLEVLGSGSIAHTPPSKQHSGAAGRRRGWSIDRDWTAAITDALRPLLDGAAALLRALDPIGNRPIPVPVPVRSGYDASAHAALARHPRVAGARRTRRGWDQL